MHVPRGLGSEVPLSNPHRSGGGTDGPRHPDALRVEGRRGARAEHPGRPHARAVVHPAEARDLGFHGILEGKLAIKVMKSDPRLRKKPYWGTFGRGGTS